MKNLSDRAGTIYSRVNDSCGGYPGVLVRTFQRFGDARAHQAAASMAYYAIFSLFPLLLLLIATGSAVLESHAVQQQLMKLASMALPIGQEFIGTTIQRTVEPCSVRSGGTIANLVRRNRRRSIASTEPPWYSTQ